MVDNSANTYEQVLYSVRFLLTRCWVSVRLDISISNQRNQDTTFNLDDYYVYLVQNGLRVRYSRTLETGIFYGILRNLREHANQLSFYGYTINHDQRNQAYTTYYFLYKETVFFSWESANQTFDDMLNKSVLQTFFVLRYSSLSYF